LPPGSRELEAQSQDLVLCKPEEISLCRADPAATGDSPEIPDPSTIECGRSSVILRETHFVKLFVAGISHRTAPLALRERVAVPSSRQVAEGVRLKRVAGLTEVVLLSTCNRVEIYAVTEAHPGNVATLFELVTPLECGLGGHIYQREGAAALAHLFAVASGLDSMALGETEITGQVKAAYEQAHAADLTGRVLNQAFQKALGTAKQIRTQTGIGRGATSIGSAAVELAERVFGRTLAEQTILIVGAGQMGEVCVRHFIKKGVRRLLIANRSPERAQTLAAECGGRSVAWSDSPLALAQADVVIAATGCPTHLFGRDEMEQLMRLRRHRSLVLVDLGVPRNVDPDVNRLENVYLHNIDDLEVIVSHNREHRQGELAACQGVISRAVAALWPRLNRPPEWRGGVADRSVAWLLPDPSGSVAS